MSEVDGLRGRIREIEARVEDGTYRPGPWAALVREVRALPGASRRVLAPDVTRASDALHRRAGHPEVGAWVGLVLEVGAVLVSLVLLIGGVDTQSRALSLGGALVLGTAAQPLVKVSVGTLLGVRYSYAFLRVFEPRFKMRYGTYLARPRWARVVYHLAGTIGTPLALWWVSGLQSIPAWTRSACTLLAVVLVAANVGFFVAALFGAKKIGPLRVAITSGGNAGLELRAP